MGIFIVAPYALIGGFATNRLLRDKLGFFRILLAVIAGIAVGAATMLPLAFAIFYFTRLDSSGYAVIGIFAGPIFAALAAWRWRPRPRAADDLRTQ
jgi:uncharacterized membrane protein